MAKVLLKSDNIIPYGGLFSIFKLFSSSGIRQTVDSHLGKRGKTEFWDGHDKIRVASSDTIGRALRKLSCENTNYKTADGKSSYDFNVADRMNTLLLKCLKATGQLGKGDLVDFDFDHQFIPAEKKDAKYSYKKADGRKF